MNLQITGLKVDAGEGSRGGKIVGHTKSGKPIYMSHGHPSHGEFTKAEHNTAANIHRELGQKENKRSAKAGEEKISTRAKSHFAEATKHMNSGAGGGFEKGTKLTPIQKSVMEGHEKMKAADTRGL